MTEQELHQARRQKWRLDGRGARTLEEARAFLDDVGLALMYPLPHGGVLAPTFIGAYAGSDERLPTWQHAFADPRAREATDLMVRLLRQKAAFEANVFGETNFLVAGSIFPYFFALVGDRNPRQMPKPGTRSDYSPLARGIFEAIRHHGRASKQRLRELLGGEPSDAALDRALNELWSRLKITRVDYVPEQGVFWDALFNWAPEAVRDGLNYSVPEALSALLSRYMDGAVAAEQSEVEEFFSRLVPRSRVREAIHALLAAREFSFVSVGHKSLLEVRPSRPEMRPRRA